MRVWVIILMTRGEIFISFFYFSPMSFVLLFHSRLFVTLTPAVLVFCNSTTRTVLRSNDNWDELGQVESTFVTWTEGDQKGKKGNLT